MYVVVGLGNPTKKYENTRHNAGFLFVERLADFLGWDRLYDVPEWEHDDGMQYENIANSSSLAANVTFTVNIASLGLAGYEFVTSPSLNLSLIDGALLIDEATNQTALNVTVTRSEDVPVFGLTEKDFNIRENPFYVIACTEYYTNSTDYPIVYTLIFDAVPVDPFVVEVIDQRGLRATVVVSPPPDD